MSEPQLSELDKTVAVIQKTIEEGFKQNSKEHDDMKDTYTKALEKKADKETVDKIEANISKAVWIVIGAVIVAVMALVIKQ